ncbi:MAG: hypothetical protein JF612_12745, partial [Planctomycetia bacterium]|nr:hypothetical protein [Planctomycetia bacterium]
MSCSLDCHVSTQYSVLSTGRSRFVRSRRVRVGFLALLVAISSISETASPADSPPTFAEIRAIFVAKCLACHGNDPKDLKADYDLRTREAAIKGGESGDAAIVPGNPEKSPLYKAVTWSDDSLQMPPKENDRLSAEQV